MELRILLLILSVITYTIGFSKEKSDTMQMSITQNYNISDSTVPISKDNADIIDSLNNQNLALKSLLKDTQNENNSKEREISELKEKITELESLKIKRLEESNDSLQRWLTTVASNFLYIPYEEYSIQKIAIPAFLATKGTDAYKRCESRLPLLQNYKEDISSLIEFLAKAEDNLAFTIGDNDKKNKANVQLSNLYSLPLYIRYTSYDDWKNTYLGKEISSIQILLKNPDSNTTDKLSKIRKKLEKVHNNQ